VRKRAFKGVVGVALMLGSLGAAFFRTQIIRNGEFELQADDNRFRVIPIPAPRGTITDRNGKVIAETVAGYTLSVEPGPPTRCAPACAAWPASWGWTRRRWKRWWSARAASAPSRCRCSPT
jgi:cell division protein FtsI/penicillin-binding protein 2